MAFDYVGGRAEAVAIIAEYGEPSVVTLPGQKGGYDSSGNLTPDIPDVDIDGTITPIMSAKAYQIDDKNVLAGDGFCFFHSDDAVTTGMQTIINGITYRIVAIKALSSVAGVNVFRKLQLRE